MTDRLCKANVLSSIFVTGDMNQAQDQKVAVDFSVGIIPNIKKGGRYALACYYPFYKFAYAKESKMSWVKQLQKRRVVFKL